MLDALLETIGTVAVLASIAAKFVYLRKAARAGDAAAADGRADGTVVARAAHGGRRGAMPIARCKR